MPGCASEEAPALPLPDTLSDALAALAEDDVLAEGAPFASEEALPLSVAGVLDAPLSEEAGGVSGSLSPGSPGVSGSEEDGSGGVSGSAGAAAIWNSPAISLPTVAI